MRKQKYKPTRFMAKGSHYDENAADFAVRFVESLKHTKGRWHGMDFKLIGWQEEIIRDIFGIVKKDGKRQFTTAYVEIPKKNGKSELAAAIALSFALSYVTFFKMPQGGSITLASMLPILVYGYRFGTRRGIIAGLVYGLLQAVQDPWIIHPAQFLLDYPLAFAMLGLAGWLRTLRPKGKDGNLVIFLVGGVTAVILRYFAHVISGIFAFSTYAAEGYSAVAWGFLYNTFCLVDGAICLSLGALLYLNRGVRRLIFGDSAASSSSAGPEKSVASPVPESVDSSAPSSASSSASESADSTTALQ